VGAGTVLDEKQAAACIAAGAQFLLSPSLNLDVVRHANEAGIAVIPGAFTPTEIVTAWKAGADMVKVFPVSAGGGPAYIKAIRAPLPQIELVPTGGVTLETASAYIQAGASALGVGSDLADAKALKEGRTDSIVKRVHILRSIVDHARAELR
jgi:2-dehydro-3-deoxyphosphogluconate aldolase/(4S)-4-hydroxy-2-oxoglutarate aldolase